MDSRVHCTYRGVRSTFLSSQVELEMATVSEDLGSPERVRINQTVRALPGPLQQVALAGQIQKLMDQAYR
jgi:hypothetical protein